MQEVKDLASGIKEALDSLRAASAAASLGLRAEIDRAHQNAQKVTSLVSGLKEANQQVEAFLSSSGSNFPPATEQIEDPAKANINGVTLVRPK